MLVRGGDPSADRALVARLAAGDQRALERLYDQYSPLVHGLAARLTGCAATAADITQEVFVAMWTHPERYDADRGSLRTYLAALARRRSIDALRREGRAVRREERAARRTPSTPPDVEEAATAMLAAEQVRRAVAELPPDQRRAVELAYFDGLTYREVAVRLGLPEGTAKSRLRLALARLAGALRDEGAARWA